MIEILKERVRKCGSCCQKQNEPIKAEDHPWMTPEKPWERIHIDFAELEAGKFYFIIVDAFTKWIDIIPTQTTTSAWCQKQLCKIFSQFGIPGTIVSDNGPQFTSKQFEHFLKSLSITHKKTAPFHPKSNGLAERAVQTAKNHLKAIKREPVVPEEKLSWLTKHSE